MANLEATAVALAVRLVQGHAVEVLRQLQDDSVSRVGTTLLAADRLGRVSIGIELSEPYIRLTEARLKADAPMLLMEEVEKTPMRMHV